MHAQAIETFKFFFFLHKSELLKSLNSNIEFETEKMIDLVALSASATLKIFGHFRSLVIAQSPNVGYRQESNLLRIQV